MTKDVFENFCLGDGERDVWLCHVDSFVGEDMLENQLLTVSSTGLTSQHHKSPQM